MSQIEALKAPFPVDAHKWRILRSTKDGKKGLAAYYIDARDVMDRLDNVVGPGSWSTEMTVVSTAPWTVQCTLSIMLDDGTVASKTDVGVGDGQAENQKTAYSDALKRAAVHWGIGRYLYDGPQVWAEINEYKQFTKSGNDQCGRTLNTWLNKMGVKQQQAPAPAPKATTHTDNPERNGNGDITLIDSMDGIDEDDSVAVWRSWKTPGQAKAWAVQEGYCSVQAHADNAVAKLVTEQFDGQFPSNDLPAFFKAWYEDRTAKGKTDEA